MDKKTFLKSVSHLCSEMSHEKKSGFMEAMELLHDLNTDAAVGCLAARMPQDIKKSQARYAVFNLPNSIHAEHSVFIFKDHLNSIMLDIMSDLERYLNKNKVCGEKYRVKSTSVQESHVTVFLVDEEMEEPDENFSSDERFDDFLLSLNNKYGCYVSVCSDYFSK